VTAYYLGLARLLLGLVGSALLAISLNTIIRELINAIHFHSDSITSLAEERNIRVYTGIERRLQSGSFSATKRTWFGLALLVLSFLLQAISLVMQMPAPPAAP